MSKQTNHIMAFRSLIIASEAMLCRLPTPYRDAIKTHVDAAKIAFEELLYLSNLEPIVLRFLDATDTFGGAHSSEKNYNDLMRQVQIANNEIRALYGRVPLFVVKETTP